MQIFQALFIFGIWDADEKHLQEIFFGLCHKGGVI